MSIITVNMTKATEIQKDKLREERAPILEALDVEYIKADEAADVTKKADIVADKVAMRDVTSDPALAAATTPEQLKVAGMDKIEACKTKLGM